MKRSALGRVSDGGVEIPVNKSGGNRVKCQLKSLPQRESCFLLQFDCCLPQLFPQEEKVLFRFKGRGPMRHGLFRPPAWRARHAAFLARINRGQVPFELSDPVEAYRRVLDQLSATSGLTDLTDLDPYTLGVSVAGLFPPPVVCRQVAEILHEAFFSEAALELLDGFGPEQTVGAEIKVDMARTELVRTPQLTELDNATSFKKGRRKCKSSKRDNGPEKGPESGNDLDRPTAE